MLHIEHSTALSACFGAPDTVPLTVLWRLQVRAGLKSIYCSGWQVAGDANTAGDVYPDQSLYPANAVPELVRKINKVSISVFGLDCRTRSFKLTRRRRGAVHSKDPSNQ